VSQLQTGSLRMVLRLNSEVHLGSTVTGVRSYPRNHAGNASPMIAGLTVAGPGGS
jgi:hypothetical protein